jgi:hypothetical protein
MPLLFGWRHLQCKKYRGGARRGSLPVQQLMRYHLQDISAEITVQTDCKAAVRFLLGRKSAAAGRSKKWEIAKKIKRGFLGEAGEN